MSEDQPLVSIIITSYNYGIYLGKAIDSALNQTYSNTEVIVIDDGSTDNSREIIASYKEKIIPIYQENQGQACASKAGLDISNGSIICFLDSDDIWLTKKVETVVEALNVHPNAIVAYHKVQNIDAVGRPMGKPWPPYKPIVGDISSQVARTGGWWPFPPTTALSFSRKFLCKVMNVPEAKYKICLDAYLAEISPFLGEVVGIDQFLSYYRCHDSNQWNDAVEVAKDKQKIRVLQDYELRETALNSGLKRLGIDLEVSLTDNWPYQLTKYQLGKQGNLIYLSLLALRNPWEHRLFSKLKTVALLWLQQRSFSRM